MTLSRFMVSLLVTTLVLAVACACLLQPQHWGASADEVPRDEWSDHGKLPATVSGFTFSLRNGATAPDLQSKFKVQRLVNIPDVRQLAVSKDGKVIFAGTRRASNDPSHVYAVFVEPRQVPGAGKTPAGLDQFDLVVQNVTTVVNDLNMPAGVAYDDDTDTLFVVDVTSIRKYDGVVQRLRSQAVWPLPYTIIHNLPTQVINSWKSLAIARTGDAKKVVYAVGAPCDACEVPEPQGTVSMVNYDGTGNTVIARGVRNSVGFDVRPGSEGELWFTDCGRDGLGDGRPCDEVNVVQDIGAAQSSPAHYGFPYCYGSTDNDPAIYNGSCTSYVANQYCVHSHSTPLGLAFYDTNDMRMMPEQLVGNKRSVAFVAERGSFNINPPQGYRISTFDASDKSQQSYQPFIEGFNTKSFVGRVVDVEVYPSDGGSLLVSDDKTGTIYRVTYGYSNAGLSRMQGSVLLSLLLAAAAVLLSL